MDTPTKPERPPLRATCWPKGTRPVLGQCGRITDVYSDHGQLKAEVCILGRLTWQSYPVEALDWCHAPANETRPGGKPLPTRPKDFQARYNTLPKGWTHATA